MKKILYFLLLSTMVMYFTGCKDKNDDGESVEITESNIIGKWSCYKYVDSEGEDEGYGSGEYDYYTFDVDGTYKYEGKWKDEETNKYETETDNGTWKLNGTKITFDGETRTIKKLTTKVMVLRYEEEDYWEELYFKKI